MEGAKKVLFDIANLENMIFSDGWSVESIEDTFNKSYNIIYVAILVEGETRLMRLSHMGQGEYTLQGYVIANLVADESELLRIAVAPSYRKSGIGQKLLTYYIDDVGDACERYLLEVRQSNKAARTLYERQGYNHIHTRKNYYQAPVEDGLIYELVKSNNLE